MSTIYSILPKIVRQDIEVLKWITGIGERPSSKMEGIAAILTAMRTAVTAAALFAMHMLPKYRAAVALTTLVISLPAFGMLFGVFACYVGVNALSKAIFLNKTESIFPAVIHLLTAWNFAKWSKNLPFGLLESSMIKWSVELGNYLYSDMPTSPEKALSEVLEHSAKKGGFAFPFSISPKKPKE